MNYLEYTYITYLTLSIAITIWVARTLHKNGRAFLIEAFAGNESLADSVNHLLVVGFYLLNAGYITLTLKYGDKPINLSQSIEFLSTKLGLALIVLGAMHFANIYIFHRLRKRGTLHLVPPPVEPDQTIEPVTL